jgi:S-adenosylmethionine hydrolase
MSTSHVITLLTDFGTTDAYVGIVKGVLYTRAPEARVVDLVHAAESGSLYAAAYLLMLLEARRHTCHSRLIYAPAAAALINGVGLDELGPPLSSWTTLRRAVATLESNGRVAGEVVHIDRFGNLVTNIHGSQLPSRPRITVGSTGRTTDRAPSTRD